MSADEASRAKSIQYELLDLVAKCINNNMSHEQIVTYLLNIAAILSVAADIPIAKNIDVLEHLYSAATEDKTSTKKS